MAVTVALNVPRRLLRHDAADGGGGVGDGEGGAGTESIAEEGCY